MIPSQEDPNSLIEDHVSVAIEKLKESDRPLFLLGHGVRLSGSAELFKRFGESQNPMFIYLNAADLLNGTTN